MDNCFIFVNASEHVLKCERMSTPNEGCSGNPSYMYIILASPELGLEYSAVKHTP